VPRPRAHHERGRAEHGLGDLGGVGLKAVRVGRVNGADRLRVAGDRDPSGRRRRADRVAVRRGELPKHRAGLGEGGPEELEGVVCSRAGGQVAHKRSSLVGAPIH
jgi:hypothetical protein